MKAHPLNATDKNPSDNMDDNTDHNINNMNNRDNMNDDTNHANNTANNNTAPPTPHTAPTDTAAKRFTIRLFDTESDVTRSVHFSLRAVRMLAVGAGAGLLVLVAASALSLYTLMHAYRHAAETAQLREANRIQQEQILTVSKKAAALEEELGKLRRTEESLRVAVGAPAPQPEDANPKAGDAAPTDAVPTGGAPHETTTDDLGEALAALERHINVRRSSLSNLAALVQKNYPGASLGIDAPVTTPTGWPTSGFISSPYGLRFGGTEFHQGIDIAADIGTPITATADGIVTAAGWSGSGYGNMVDIDHGNGITTRYGHASAVAVTPGERVRRGQIIAYVGSTGHSTGPHLHYVVRLN